MSTKTVADRLVELCRQGQFDAATEELYHPDIVSVEAEGEMRECRGMDAIRAKIDWWNNTFEVVGAQVNGPWINEPYFIVNFIIDVKNRETGEATHMEEYAVYQVEGDKIVHERFFG